MDAPDADADVKLHKISADLIADLDGSLTALLRKPVRARVRARETVQATTAVLDAFQELPQLLDAHLPRWIPLLAGAYLEFGRARHRLRRGDGAAAAGGLLVPLDQAVCRVLYAFCKVRGEKVIVRCLSADTRCLEVLLADMERAEAGDDAWPWEQRYVVLLWLSHLVLVPFDLSTLSPPDSDPEADDDAAAAAAAVPGLVWPATLPGIAARAMRLALKYLAAPGRERDAARALLVRLALRRDMQQLGVLDSLVHWALAALRPRADAPLQTPHFYLGVLAFLAGVLRSAAETSDMDRHRPAVFQAVYDVARGESPLARALVPLATIRKTVIKVLRAVVVSLLRTSPQDAASTELVETAIAHLLDSLADSDTPVRLAASKALSIVALKLEPDMAAQVVEAVLEALGRNVLWAGPVRDLSAVNQLEWHGLMLTLAHLLFRRSPPASQLSDIIHALLLGLSFEQRSTSGSSVGANVRDAACFGVWATARRYTSQELLGVPTGPVVAARAHPPCHSMLQVLATELVVTACLDPAGNIRRGASAALQELVGRHPDTVVQGIAVVQTVDYHAVARRSRAVREVAASASRLSPAYGEALVDGILGWRGIGDGDAASRRDAGFVFGAVTAELAHTCPDGPLSRFEAAVRLVRDRVQSLAKRQVEERHGLLACFASVIDHLPRAVRGVKSEQGHEGTATDSVLRHSILTSVSEMLDACKAVDYRKPELVAEGASRLVVSSLPVILASAARGASHADLQTGREILSPSSSPSPSQDYMGLVSLVDSSQSADADVAALVARLRVVLPAWLSRNEAAVVETASAAALVLLVLSGPEDRAKTLQAWADTVRSKPAGRTAATERGYLHALALAQPLGERCRQGQGEGEGEGEGEADLVCEAFLERWRVDVAVDNRVAILESLIRSRAIRARPWAFLQLLRQGLDDYTTNARGDVGSHVRVQALRAVQLLWEHLGDGGAEGEAWARASVEVLLDSTLRLAAEKLDRVRAEAQAAVALTLGESHGVRFRSLGFSSTAYFERLLELVSGDGLQPWLSAAGGSATGARMAELLAGFVTSADTGDDKLVAASRRALAEFCDASSRQLDSVCGGLLDNVRARRGGDRVVVPTLEILAYLARCDLLQRCRAVSLDDVCRQTQRAGHRTGSVRKALACVRVYGGVAATTTAGRSDGVQEARRRLGALMWHPWPRVRNAVVDELWHVLGGDWRLMGVDWGSADGDAIRALVDELGLV